MGTILTSVSLRNRTPIAAVVMSYGIDWVVVLEINEIFVKIVVESRRQNGLVGIERG